MRTAVFLGFMMLMLPLASAIGYEYTDSVSSFLAVSGAIFMVMDLVDFIKNLTK